MIASLPLLRLTTVSERIPRLKREEMDLCMQMRKLTNVEETVRKHDTVLCRVLKTVAEISRATTGSEQRNWVSHDDQSSSRATNEREQRNSTSRDDQPSSQTTRRPILDTLKRGLMWLQQLPVERSGLL